MCDIADQDIASAKFVEQPSGRDCAGKCQGWLEENREALLCFNQWHEENGNPLDERRMF